MPNPISAVWPGKPFPQGATWDGEGVNFALFSEHATGVELCLFDDRGRRELQRIPLREQTDQVWHCYLPEARPGQLYGYRVHGPYQPQQGHRFNPHKLLLDPYAKAIVGSLAWSDAHFGYRIGSQRADLSQDRRNNAERHAEVPGHRSGVLVGRRPQSAHAVARHRHLRNARARLHQAASAGAAAVSRHLRGARHDAGHRVPEATSASRRSS